MSFFVRSAQMWDLALVLLCISCRRWTQYVLCTVVRRISSLGCCDLRRGLWHLYFLLDYSPTGGPRVCLHRVGVYIHGKPFVFTFLQSPKLLLSSCVFLAVYAIQTFREYFSVCIRLAFAALVSLDGG